MHFFNSHERAKSYLANWKGRRRETDKISVMTYPLSMSSTNQPVSCVVSWVTRMYFACSFCCCMMIQLFLLLPPKNELISKFLVVCTVHEAIPSMGVRCITLPRLQFWSMSDIRHCRQVCIGKSDGDSLGKGLGKSLYHVCSVFLVLRAGKASFSGTWCGLTDIHTMCQVWIFVQILFSSPFCVGVLFLFSHLKVQLISVTRNEPLCLSNMDNHTTSTVMYQNERGSISK